MSLTGALEEDQLLSAEQSVLGAIFLDPTVLDDIVFLEERDFLSKRHQQIYKVMRWLDRKELPVDVITVTEQYLNHNKQEDLNVGYFTELAESCPTTANVVHHARIVRSKAIRRRGAEIGTEIANLSREDFESDEEYYSAVERLAAQIRPKDSGKMESLEELRGKYFNHLLHRPEMMPTGFPQFDAWSGGLGRGDLFVSAGRPSVGKTAKLLARCFFLANKGIPVALFSQEMDVEQLIDRMISAITEIPYGRIFSKNLSPDELGKIEEVYKTIEDIPLFIQDTAAVTIDEVRATAKRIKRQYGDIGMVAVDYLQIMKIPKKPNETRAEAIGHVTGTAKQIARELKCCFMLLSQMSRESEKNKGKPTLADLRESGNIEQDADVVEFLWRDDKDTHPEGKVVQQFIAKGRNIGINEFRLLFKGWKMQFTELDK